MKNSKGAKRSASKKARSIRLFLCAFLLVAMILPFVPEGALYVDALNDTFGPVESATTESNGSYITGKPAVYIVGDGYAITWVTSFNGIGWVTYTGANGQTVERYDERNGILRTNDTIHTVKIPEEDYQYLCNGYTVHSKKVTEHWWGVTRYDESTNCSYKTRLKDTKPTGNEEADILVLTDVHGYTGKLSRYFDDYKSFLSAGSDPDIVAFLGDTNTVIDTQTKLENLFIIMGNTTLGQYPIIYARGNHDTRGEASVNIIDYFPTKTGQFYFDFTFGNLWGVVLDTAEDKADTHGEYGFQTNFSEYITKQKIWLESLSMPTDPSIKYRLGVYHIPSLETLARRAYTANTYISYYLPGIDMTESMSHLGLQFAISGHRHKFQIYQHAVKDTGWLSGYTSASEVSNKITSSKYKYSEDDSDAYLNGGTYAIKDNSGNVVSFRKSSLKHSTFVAGGGEDTYAKGSSGFVKLSATAGNATIYALDKDGNDAKVNGNGSILASGTTFSSRTDPSTVDLYDINNDSNVSAKATTSALENGTVNYFYATANYQSITTSTNATEKKRNRFCTGGTLPAANYTGKSSYIKTITDPAVLETGGDWYNVVWMSSDESAGFVQVTYNGKTYQFFDEVAGKRRNNDTVHTVKVPKKYLDNNKYFVGNWLVEKNGDWRFYEDVYYTSEEYLFEDRSNDKTPNILLMSNYGNTEEHYEVPNTLAANAIAGLSSDYSFIAANGDILFSNTSSLIEDKDNFYHFFEALSKLSKGNKLVVFSRGNIECRGFFATEIIKYLPTVTGEFYYTFNYGDYTFVNLDTMEDKIESNEENSGRVKSEAFFAKENEWLENILADENNGFKDNIAVISHNALYNMDFPASEDKNDFSYLKLNWGKKLRQKGALINLAGHLTVPSIKQGETSERFLFTVFNGGYEFHNLSNNKTKSYSTAASVLLAEEYAYITFCQYKHANDDYTGPYYESYGDSETVDDELGEGQKAYSLITSEEIHYQPYEPPFDSEANTYKLSQPSHLAWLSWKVQKGENFSGKKFVLENDIDLMLYPFTPIGGYDEVTSDDAVDVYGKNDYFSGTFDGNGYKIKNLNILPSKDKYASHLLNNEVGLFGAVVNGNIKNLTVEGGFIKGGWNTGALVGLFGTASGTYEYHKIENCYTNVTVYAPGGTDKGASKVGGLVGNIFYAVEINKCANFGNVIKTRDNGSAGGIVGAAYCYSYNGASNSTNINSAVKKDTAGEIYDIYALSKILNTFNRGNVYSSLKNGNGTGGIVGNYGRTYGLIENCYNAALIYSVNNNSGAIVGAYNGGTSAVSLDIKNCYYLKGMCSSDRIIILTNDQKLKINGTVARSGNESTFASVGQKSSADMQTSSFVTTLNASAYQLPAASYVGIKYNNGYPVHTTMYYAPNSVNSAITEAADKNVNQQFSVDGSANLTSLNDMPNGSSMYVLVANGNNFLVYDSGIIKTSTLTQTTSKNSKVHTFVWKLTKTANGFKFVSVNGQSTLTVSGISNWTLTKGSTDNKYKLHNGSSYLTSSGTSVSVGSTQTQWYIFPILQDMDNNVTFGFSGRSSWTTGGTENMGIASTITSLSVAEAHKVEKDYGKFTAKYDSVYGTNLAPGKNFGWSNLYSLGFFRNEAVMASAMVAPDETAQLMRMKCTYGNNNYMLWSISPRIQTTYQKTEANDYVYHLTLTYGKNGTNENPAQSIEFRTDTPSADNTPQTKYQSTQNFFVVYSLNEDGGYYIIPLSDTTNLKAIGVSTEDKTSLEYANFDSASEERFWIQADKREIKAEVVDVLVEITKGAEGYVITDMNVQEDSRFSTTVKYGSAFYQDYEMVKVAFDKNAYPGYTYMGNSAPVATYKDTVCYRYFRPNVYNVTFNSSLKNDSETIQLEYTEKLSDAIAQWKLKNSFTVSFDTNGGSGVSSKTYTWDVSSFTASSNQYSVNSEDEKMQNIAALFGVVKTDKANISAITVNWKDNPLNLSDVTKPTRDNYAFYGWSSNSAIGSESGIQTTLSNVKNDTTVYAYWAGADYKEVSEKRASTLNVVPKVYGATERFTLGSGYTVEWYRVGPFDANGAFIKTADSYGVSADDKGKILKAVFKYNGVTVSSAYSAYLPGDVLVDANADDSTEEKAFVKVTSSETVPAESTVDVLYGGGTEIISGAINKTGLKFKVYGIIDDGNGTEVFLFDDTKPYLTSYIGAENGGVSYQGTSFIKVRVYFTNDTNNSITVNSDNFFLTTNPKVYKATLNDNGFGGEIQYINGSDYVSGQRALDASKNKYFYNGDFIRVIVNKLSDGEKLSAGSYLDVGGIRVYPTYTNGANITFSYMNEFEHLIKNEALSSIKIGGKDLTVTVNFKAAANVSGTNNINIGPLGAKTYDKNGIKKIRFGTVWYLDDVVSANKWYRGDEFGSYIIMFKNLLKTTQNNDFYNYLVKTYGQTKADSIKTTWDNYASDVNKEELFEYLKKFLEDWNEQEDALKLNKIRFGSAEIDVPAHYYYYRDGKNESNSFAVNGAIKAYIEFSAVLSFAGAPAEMLARDLVYLPYASYVHEHNSGFFVPESEKPNNVYQFELPQKIYTYNSLGQNNG